jgi:predicted nucleotidyltransferase component of viral defense system
LQTANYPTSIAELESWQRQHKTTKEEARRRLAQFVILASIASSNALVSRVAFKGGNALRFVHGNLRSTLDLDFSADGDFPDNAEAIRLLMDTALKSAEQCYQVKAKSQSCHRMPPGLDKTRPTYNLKLCYQFPGDRYYQNFEERTNFSEVVEVEISLNDVVCETDEQELHPSAKPVRVCTLNDIIAEKLRAILQQVPRRRSRPQDVFDIASMIRRHGDAIDLSKVSVFLVQKSEARDIIATKSAFNDAVRERAAVSYVQEIRPFTTAFIPFDEAWDDLLRLVSRLSISD